MSDYRSLTMDCLRSQHCTHSIVGLGRHQSAAVPAPRSQSLYHFRGSSHWTCLPRNPTVQVEAPFFALRLPSPSCSTSLSQARPCFPCRHRWLPMVKILSYRICHGPAMVAMRTTTRDLPLSSTVCAARR